MSVNDLEAVTPEIRVRITPHMLRAYAQSLDHEARCVTGADGETRCPGHDDTDYELVPEELWG